MGRSIEEPLLVSIIVGLAEVIGLPLFKELCESLDYKYMVGCAARFPATMHGEDGIAHIDTPQRIDEARMFPNALPPATSEWLTNR